MSTLCEKCPRTDDYSVATNEVGTEVQQHHMPAGWVAIPQHQFQTCCEAVDAMSKFPDDGIERRIYPTLVIKGKKQ